MSPPNKLSMNALFSAGLGRRGRMGAWAVALVGAGAWMYAENESKKAKALQGRAETFSPRDAEAWNAEAKKRQQLQPQDKSA